MFTESCREDRFKVLENRAKEILRRVKLLKDENTKLKVQIGKLLEQRVIARKEVNKLLNKLHFVSL
ncbi:MAG: hypothetical protein QMD71_09365 [bacterium]|nr:hypothetical protein [bacterium]